MLIRKVAVVGTGLIGASWALHFLARGLDVLGLAPDADSARPVFHAHAQRAVEGKARGLVEGLGAAAASPAQARSMLGLKP